MKISGKELDAIRERVADGTASDDDRRLADLYVDTDENTEPEDKPVLGEFTATGTAEVVPARKATRGRAKPKGEDTE